MDVAAHQDFAAFDAARFAAAAQDRRHSVLALRRVIEAEARRDPAMVVAVLDFYLEEFAPQFPDVAPTWSTARQDAAYWAECCTTNQLVAMLSATATEAKARSITPRLLGDLFKSIWAALPGAWRRAFVDRVAKGSDA